MWGHARGTLLLTMPYVVVLLVSLLVGVGAYVVTVRAARQDAGMGFGDGEQDPASPGDPPPGYAYLQVSTQGPALRDRLQGFVGLVLLIGISAFALAFAIYQAGHLINRTIEAFVDQ
jgi:hypothetical protein